MKFKYGDKVKVLPFEITGKRYTYYDDGMLEYIGKVGIISEPSSLKPKHRVDFFDENGEMIDFWWFFSSDLKLTS